MATPAVHGSAVGPVGRRRARAQLAFEILAAYARMAWSLRRRGLVATVERLRRLESETAVLPGSDFAAARFARAVPRVLAPLPTDTRCLMRSLVLSALLARRGIRSSLVVGVRPGPDFGAHAWVEVNGVPLLPPGGAVYGELAEL